MLQNLLHLGLGQEAQIGRARLGQLRFGLELAARLMQVYLRVAEEQSVALLLLASRCCTKGLVLHAKVSGVEGDGPRDRGAGQDEMVERGDFRHFCTVTCLDVRWVRSPLYCDAANAVGRKQGRIKKHLVGFRHLGTNDFATRFRARVAVSFFLDGLIEKPESQREKVMIGKSPSWLFDMMMIVVVSGVVKPLVSVFSAFYAKRRLQGLGECPGGAEIPQPCVLVRRIISRKC